MYREHPVKILKYSAKNVWLLIFPLLRGIKNFTLSSDFLYSWLKGAWFDILIVGLIIIFGMIKWYFSLISIGEEGITHTNGILIKVKTVIPYKNICLATFEHPFYLMPFGAVKFRCDTGSGILSSADMKLTLNDEVCSLIRRKLSDTNKNSSYTKIPKPTVLSVVLFSLFFSSGLSGALYMSAFFYKGGDISQRMIAEYLKKISQGTEKVAGNGIMKISDAAFAIGVFFIGAWFLSFLVNIQRYSRFSVNTDERCMKLSYGAVTKREYHIVSSHINYTDLRQNLIMKLFRAITVHISCPGYGSGRSSLPVLIPVKKEKRMNRELEAMGLLSGHGSEFRPAGIRNMWQYVWMTVLPAIFSFPLHIVISRLILELYDLTLFIAIMAEVPAVWLTFVKLTAFFTSGISLYDDKIMVRCSKWTTFHTVIADRGKLVQLETEQTIFQKRRNACSLIFYFEGENRTRYKVKGIGTSDTEAIVSLLEHGLLSDRSA